MDLVTHMAKRKNSDKVEGRDWFAEPATDDAPVIEADDLIEEAAVEAEAEVEADADMEVDAPAEEEVAGEPETIVEEAVETVAEESVEEVAEEDENTVVEADDGENAESGEEEVEEDDEDSEDDEDGDASPDDGEDSPLTLSSVVEAVLFAARDPLKLPQIARAVGKRTRQEMVREAIDELNVHYLETGRAFEIAEISGRYQLMSRPEFAPHIMKIYPKP